MSESRQIQSEAHADDSQEERIHAEEKEEKARVQRLYGTENHHDTLVLMEESVRAGSMNMRGSPHVNTVCFLTAHMRAAIGEKRRIVDADARYDFLSPPQECPRCALPSDAFDHRSRGEEEGRCCSTGCQEVHGADFCKDQQP